MLDAIKQKMNSLDQLVETGVVNVSLLNDFNWLIKQAEQLEKIKKLSNAEKITLADFAKEVLQVLEGRETPTRTKRG